MKLRKMCPGMQRKKKMIEQQTESGLTENVRRWCYTFPCLDECRVNFTETVGIDVDWGVRDAA